MVYISRIADRGTTWEILASDTGVKEIHCQSTFLHGSENEISRQAAEQLSAYLTGSRKQFDLPLDPEGTPFQKQVWQALCQIPYGTGMSYSQIAQQIGRPDAVRAVAGAIGKNPCLIVVPCHRVLGKDGRLTGFSAGLDMKRRLLQLEGIAFRD